MLLEKSECLPVPLYHPIQFPATPGSVHGKGYCLGLVKAPEGAEAGTGLLWTVAWSLPRTPLACPLAWQVSREVSSQPFPESGSR